MELAEMIGVRAHSQRVHVDELGQADDAFITSSAGGVMPVNSVDGVALGGREGVGELAARFHDLYWEQVWQGWKCAPVTYEEAAARVQ
jgi:branched-chain amino acid aminotransferase